MSYTLLVQLKIVSWNIWIDGDLEGIKDFLAKEEADIVGLQEVIEGDPTFNVIEFLTKVLGYHYFYAPALDITWPTATRRGKMGNAIFSKSALLETKVHNLSESDNRVAVEAKIKAGNRILNIFCTHLIHTHQMPSETQNLQAENLVKILPRERVILMGDFNSTEDSEPIEKIRKVLKNTDPEHRPTWSNYPEGCKDCLPGALRYKLDHIFISSDLKLNSFRVEDSKASDHLPIMVEIEI